MLAKVGELLYQVVRLSVMLLCISLFLSLMNGIWIKFIGKETVMTVKLDIEDITEKYPPCVTACPFTAFKKQGRFFNHFLRFN